MPLKMMCPICQRCFAKDDKKERHYQLCLERLRIREGTNWMLNDVVDGKGGSVESE